MSLSREAILAADDRPLQAVEVPEWGGTVYVRAMSGADRDEFEQSVREERGTFRALLLAPCLCDESGNRLFSVDDIAALGAKSASALDRVVAVVLRTNKLGDAELERAEKN